MDTKFWGIFLIVIGIIGIITGSIKGTLLDSVPMFVGYLLPGLIGILLIVLNKTGGKRKK
ncbi:MAG: hypothetical protein ACI3XD_06265 [Oscillospiraceae bacterium]|nr:hypothetical protein [Clostridiales bacterium]MDY2961181.1 hypothetical protein [Oscillospiraceae bacterium]MDD6077107.1 hypothetical protein [Clostridiales bacterium]MDD6108474.1 hypothetical protein [Clostridiales bacterium]MDD6935757.1 hypothetical protein [Clostridiales bacterium]